MTDDDFIAVALLRLGRDTDGPDRRPATGRPDMP
jgi:hypothetical protein